jgi:hypothetical protein
MIGVAVDMHDATRRRPVMPDSMIYLSIAVAALIVVLHLRAIISVFRSNRSVGSKTLWALLIWIFPLVGLIAWVVAGPRGHNGHAQHDK